MVLELGFVLNRMFREGLADKAALQQRSNGLKEPAMGTAKQETAVRTEGEG